MSTIQQVHKLLKDWKERFPGLGAVAACLTKDFVILRWEWEGALRPPAVHVLTIAEVEAMTEEEEQFIFDSIESVYIKWETGEE